MNRIKVLTSIAIIMVLGPLLAQTDTLFSPNAPSELRKLAPLVGQWQLRTYFLQKDGSYHESSAEMNVSLTLQGNALLFQQHYWGRDHYYAELFLNYNKDQQRWVGASINTLGNRKTVEGAFANDTLILVQTGMLFGGREGKNRLKFFDITNDRLSLSQDAFDQNTNTWTIAGFKYEAYKLAGPDFSNVPLSEEEVANKPVFTNLDEALKEPLAVYRLDLSGQKIKSLPAAITRLQNLHELKLQDTYIEQLPEEIGALKFLTRLSIQHLEQANENLINLPESVAELKHLRFVNLIGNPNLQFSRAFQLLGNSLRLNNIALMNNRLTQLPPSITSLKFLEMIWLGKNPDLDTENALHMLSSLVRMKKIGFGSCQFESIPVALLNKIRFLDTIWLANNNLTIFPDFSSLEHLQSLTLKNNRIGEIPASAEYPPQLAYLDLSGNEGLDLESVAAYLKKQSKLRYLRLENMDLETLDIDFNNLSIETVYLQGNKFTADEQQRLRSRFSAVDFKFD